jgi:5'-3' exonuclease
MGRTGASVLKKLLLIDGDEFIFKACAAVEEEVMWDDQNHVLFSNANKAWKTLSEMFERIFDRFETKDCVVCFSNEPRTNFRYSVDPTYKNNRAESRKPLCYKTMRGKVEENFKWKDFPYLEADDVMGLLSTQPTKSQKIIVSQDKDMKTIPTTVWIGKDLLHISEQEADYWHMFQTLVGDTSDGYRGCPGIGKVKAEKLLYVAKPEGMEHTYTNAEYSGLMWAAVVKAYEKAGLTEADALVQARLARILRWEDWDQETKEPILWKPQA